MMTQTSRISLLLLVWLPIVFGATSPRVVDLSYKHYVEPSKLEEVIRTSSCQSDSLEVDISCSLLGDEKGFQGIVQALLPTRDASKSSEVPPMGVSFVSRGNRLTPRSVEGLLQTLLSSATTNNSTNETKTDVDANQTIATTSENQTNNNVSDSQNSTLSSMSDDEIPITRRPWMVRKLDVGWNHLQLDAPGWKSFLKALQQLIQSKEACPGALHFDRCGLSPGACRAIGKGIINRYSTSSDVAKKTTKPLSLHLCGNPDLGDSGVAAIAAAIRTVVTDGFARDVILLDTLDLSACGIGDVGAEALALALESCPGMCIRHLDLSHNQLSNVGAAAIGHALLSSGAAGLALESLDMSGNTGITDKGAIVLAEAVEKGLIASIRLRSCHILADGAAAFGKAIAVRARKTTNTASNLEVDLSGNPLGVLRGKTKKGGKYSASAIKSKATATTAAYMSRLRKGLKSGLKEYGVEFDALGGNSAESDDEEEERSGLGDDILGEAGDLDPKKARCAIKAFANAILDNDTQSASTGTKSSLKCDLALRRCFLDHGAADALAAVLVHAKEDMGLDLSIDVAMNPVLEEEMTDAIQGEEGLEDVLRDMSDRYLEALEALREARERAIEAAKAAAARLQAEKDYESQWDVPDDFPNYDWEEEASDEEEQEWDSDADYEQEDEEYY